MAFQRVDLHRFAADPPALGHQLGAAELADLLTPVPRLPAFAADVLIFKAKTARLDDRRVHRDAAHALHAASEHHVLNAGHDGLRCEVNSLLRRSALPINGHACNMHKASRRQAMPCAPYRAPVLPRDPARPRSRRRRQPDLRQRARSSRALQERRGPRGDASPAIHWAARWGCVHRRRDKPQAFWFSGPRLTRRCSQISAAGRPAAPPPRLRRRSRCRRGRRTASRARTLASD